MLAFRKPFPGPDLPALLRQLQFEEPPPLGPTVPPDLAALVAHAMAKNPDDRPGRVEELSAALVRFRRQYQAETRKLVLATRTQFDAVDALVKSLADAGELLGIPPSGEPAAALLAIQARFPPLANRHAGAEAVAFERARVVSILHHLDDQRQQLAAALEALRSH